MPYSRNALYSFRPKPPYPTVGARRITLSSSQTSLCLSADSVSSSDSSSSVSFMDEPSDSVTDRWPVIDRELTSPPLRSWSSESTYRSQPLSSCASTHSYSAARSPQGRPLSLRGCPSSRVAYSPASGIRRS